MSSDVASWVRECAACQRGKVVRHLRPPPSEFPADVQRFASIHCDIVGPLEPSDGKRYLLTFIDRESRWFECVPTDDVSAASVATIFIDCWVSRYGVPQQVTSDRGAQFVSTLFTSLCNILGSNHTPSCSYHPECNGLVERLHRRLKDALRSHAALVWTELLPWVLLGLRAAPRSDDDVSTYEHVFGLPPRLPGAILPSSALSTGHVAEDVGRLKQALPVRPRPPPPPSNVPPGMKFVYLKVGGARTPLSPIYQGPYRVLSQRRNTVRIRLGDRTDTVNLGRVKPCLDPAPLIALPRRRGRPPRNAGGHPVVP